MPRASQARKVKHPARTLYISDPAYAELVRQARQAGYITSSTTNRLSQYLQWLLTNCVFDDTRPEAVKALDADMIAAYMAPEWRLHSPRLPRQVCLSNEALSNAAVQAATLGMAFHPAKRMLGAPTFFDDVQCAAILLEALGTSWVQEHILE